MSRNIKFDQGGYGKVETIYKTGAVYLCKVVSYRNPDRILFRKGVAKRLTAGDPSSSSQSQPDHENRDEVELLRDAKHHHVVELLDVYENDLYRFLVMPFIQMNLSEYLAGIKQTYFGRSPFDGASFEQERARITQWIYCLANTIQYLHRHRIRHCDIKPQNILVQNDHILIADFGISFISEYATGEGLTGSVGTAKYLPPEAAAQHGAMTRIGFSGDIWSLGCVFYELLWHMSPGTMQKRPHMLPDFVCSYREARLLNPDLIDTDNWVIDIHSRPPLYHPLTRSMLYGGGWFDIFRMKLGPFVWARMLEQNGKKRAGYGEVCHFLSNIASSGVGLPPSVGCCAIHCLGTVEGYNGCIFHPDGLAEGAS